MATEHPPRRRFFRLLQWQLIRTAIWLVPGSRRIQTHDRTLLEQVIFQEIFLTGRYRNILFAGCASYTSWYPWIFECFDSIRFETIDQDPANQQHGCRRHHRVGRLEELVNSSNQVGPYDLVILNGLFGFGTDDAEGIRQVISASRKVLQPGGMLLIGFNDVAGNARFDPDWISERDFRRGIIPGTNEHDFLAQGEHRHRFVSFIRR